MCKRVLLAIGMAAVLTAGPGAARAQFQPDLDGGFGDLGGLEGRPELSKAASHFRVRAVARSRTVAPGGSLVVALVGELDDGWVFYSPDPGPIVVAGGLAVKADPMTLRQVRWPADKAKTVDYGEGPVANHVYTGRFAVYAELAVPEDARPGDAYEIVLSPTGQICLDVCVNLDEDDDALKASTTVQVVAATAATSPAANPEWTAELAAGWEASMSVEELRARHAAAAEEAKASLVGSAASAVAGYNLLAGLGLALLAGLTLNIMPCVLPIIPLRIYSLVNMAGESRRRFVTLGLAFAAGIVLFFAGLAIISAALRLLGQGALDLNEHFQYAWVRILIAMILLALSANLWGLFNVTVPNKVAAMGQDSSSSAHEHASAVGMGLMMAVLSTPCSFWLMALALAWAQLQPLWLGTVAILLIGAGMALPHVLLASQPALLKLLPKPGKWMELFKQSMGFLLVPAVVYLLSTLPAGGGWPWLVAMFGLAMVFGLWMYGSWVRYDAPWPRKLAVRGTAVVLVAVVGWFTLPQPVWKGVEFEPLDAARIAEVRAEGGVVVVKVTASWCTECKILDAKVFSKPEIAKEFTDRGVVPMVADVTDSSSRDAKWVEATIGKGGAPPVTIIYPPGDAKPRAAVGVFGPEKMIEYLDQAKAGEPGT